MTNCEVGANDFELQRWDVFAAPDFVLSNGAILVEIATKNFSLLGQQTQKNLHG
jgi:hypothetical protein